MMAISRTKLIWYSYRHPAVKIGGALFICLLLVFVYIQFAIVLPKEKEVIKITKEISLIRDSIIKGMKLIELESHYSRSIDIIEQIDHKLNADSQQATLLNNLVQLAAKNNVEIVSERYKELKELVGYIPLFQEIELTGSYKSIKKFIVDVSNLPNWIVIQDLRLESTANTKIKLNLTLATFRKIK